MSDKQCKSNAFHDYISLYIAAMQFLSFFVYACCKNKNAVNFACRVLFKLGTLLSVKLINEFEFVAFCEF